MKRNLSNLKLKCYKTSLNYDNCAFHIHTYRCKHALDCDDEAYITQAIKANYSSIVFTDHCPFAGDIFTGRMRYEQLNEYITSIKKLKKTYTGVIDVYCGLETEYLPSYNTYYNELAEKVDILLLGQHMSEIAPNKYTYMYRDIDEYKYLAEGILKALDTNYFSVIAHPDRIFKKCGIWNKEYKNFSNNIIIKASKNGVLLEDNYESFIKGYRRNEFWNMVPENLIVKGIDAHNPMDIINSVNFIRT